MDYTSNYKFKLPAKTDVIDITVLNSNFSTVDAKLSALEKKTAAVQLSDTLEIISASGSVAEAEKWVGYLEKKSNENLNNFTANAGSNNYTRFAVDYCDYYGEQKSVFQAQPWCAMFVSVVFANVFGAETAENLLGGHYAYCPYGVKHFKDIGIWKTQNPKPGDVIMFRNASGVACHTGIVYAVDSNKVYTIEGNTSSASGVVANGGCVAKKSYSLSYSRIMGYGEINYNSIEEDELMSKEYEELKAELAALKAEVAKSNSKMIYNYVDNNMPEWARPTIQKMMDKGLLQGDENGCLGLTDELLRVFVTNDRAGVYDLAPQRSADDSAESAFDVSQKC